jgi:gamma-glutamyltranspeptidase/glutathione hydrolase
MLSGRSVLVPGFMAGAQGACSRFGKLSRAQVVEPAITLAVDGFEIDPHRAGSIEFRKRVLSRLPATQRVFARGDGALCRRGDRFREPELVETLRRAAARGAGEIYTGEWARRLVDAVRREGGKIALRDLESYRVTWEAPIETTYAGARVVVPGLSSLGAVGTVEALNLLELAGVGRSGSSLRSPESLFRLMQITSTQVLGYAPEEAAKRYAGQHFSPRARVKKEQARWLWERMWEGEWLHAARSAGGSGHSSGVVAVDRWGTVAAVTHSISTAVWGKTGIFVGGVSISDSASFQ